MRAKNQEIFGEDLTASELVHRIVRDVRSGGIKHFFVILNYWMVLT